MYKYAIVAVVIFCCGNLYSQSSGTVSSKESLQWFKDGKWLNGLKLKPSPTIDQGAFYAEYHARETWWKTAFAFMNNRDNDTLSPGTYPIDGENVFAKVTEIPGKEDADAKWEAHDHYLDIHYVIKGKEKMGIGMLSGAKMIIPYEAQRDITFYDGTGKYYIMQPGEFFIAAPHQIHRPSLKADGYAGTVKKIVIKVRRVE